MSKNTKKMSEAKAQAKLADIAVGLSVVSETVHRFGIAMPCRGPGKDGSGAKTINGYTACVAGALVVGTANPYGAKPVRPTDITIEACTRPDGSLAYFPCNASQKRATVEAKAKAYASARIVTSTVMELMKYTDAQVKAIETIAQIQASMVHHRATIETLNTLDDDNPGKQAGIDAVQAMVDTGEEQIKGHKELLTNPPAVPTK